MRILKRSAAVVFVATLWCASAATGRAEPARPLRILTSFYPAYITTLNIVEDTAGVDVECMTPPTVGCLHDYQLTPGDLIKLSQADIVVANGAGMEAFIDKVLQQLPRLKVVDASQGISLAFGGNPHVWVAISGAIAQTHTVARALAEADPAHAALYAKNASVYAAKLERLRAKMHTALDHLSHRDIVTFHEAFPYFAKEFGLHIVGVVEREPGSEPNARELADTIAMLKSHQAEAVFAEPQYPAKCAEVIHRETGIPIGLLDPVVTGPRDPAAAREAYLRAMEQNLAVLVRTLSG